ncbi:MAG: hypothetical protein NZL85_00275 [Fimbriimonadales bacterium]|nr:hypothetical protein [Fimbriimonadales bacterium]
MAEQITLRSMGMAFEAARVRITDTRREPLACKHPDDAQFPYPGEPFGIAYPLSVPDFGRVYLWADGKGYTSRTHELLLERELAACRYQRSLEFIKQYQRKGVPLAELQARLDAAKPPAQPEGEPLLQSLRESLLAGEEAAIAVARFRLGRIGWREAFLWGVVLTDPATPVQPLHPPFNQLSLSMAQQSPEAWEPVVQQAQQERLLIRGESILTAEFVQQVAESPEPPQESLMSRLHDALSLYRGRIRYWEILSDLPDSLRLLADESKATLSLIGTLCEAARAIDFGIVRLLGVRYSLHHHHAPFDLLDRLVESGVPFEGVNLHLYWHDFDLLDFDFVVEHYGELGKPLHLTLHLPPAERGQAGDFFWWAPASEAVQADWLLSAFTIALSKPFVVGVQIALEATAESAIQRLREQRQAWKQGITP